MFDFLWHRRSSVDLPSEISDADAIERIARLLEKQKKRICDRGPEHITFDDPIWSDTFAFSWLSMIIYDRGTFSIEHGATERTLGYDLCSLRFIVFCIFISLMFFLIRLTIDDPFLALKIGLGCFTWLYGTSSLLAWVRGSIVIEGAVRPA